MGGVYIRAGECRMVDKLSPCIAYRKKGECLNCGTIKVVAALKERGCEVYKCPACGCGDTLILPKEDCAGQQQPAGAGPYPSPAPYILEDKNGFDLQI